MNATIQDLKTQIRQLANIVSQLQSSSDPLYDLDREIEITLRRLRKARNIVVSNSNSSNSVSSFDNSSPVTTSSNSFEHSSTTNFVEPE
ncbi:hypothetical protein CR513_14463, partial [Mucuna pruriens]